MENTENRLKKLEKIYDGFKVASNNIEFTKIKGELSNFFCNLTSGDINKISEVVRVYPMAIIDVIKNPLFISVLKNILDKHKSIKEEASEKINKIRESLKIRDILKNKEINSSAILEEFKKSTYEINNKKDEEIKSVLIEEKKLINNLLLTSTMFLVPFVSILKKEDIFYLRSEIDKAFKNLKKCCGDKHSNAEIYYALNGVFSRDYSNEEIFDKYIEIGYFFKLKVSSSYLIKLIINLSFRTTLLNILFRYSSKSPVRNISKIKKFIEDQKSEEIYDKSRILGMIEEGFIDRFIDGFQEKNKQKTFHLIDIFLSELKSPTPGTIGENNKIVFTSGDPALLVNIASNAKKIIPQLEEYAKTSFHAFKSHSLSDYSEWSNKVFINCYKSMSVFSVVSVAVNEEWKKNFVIREFAEWTHSINKILNKEELEDDWEKISNLLDQETNKIEWKSTFFSPINMNPKSEEEILTARNIGKEMSKKIVQTIIGMMNTDGGAIIVGLVERPEDVVADDFKKRIFKKNGKDFLDVSYELSKNKTGIDEVKRSIQDEIKNNTLTRIDKFDKLWDIEEVEIKPDLDAPVIYTYKINVFKSENPIFSIKKENTDRIDNIWVSLIRRVNARNVVTDPRELLRLDV